jgi:hypothetical protein
MGGVTVGPPHSIQRKLTRPSAVRDHVISTRPSVANRDQYCSVGGEFMQGNCNRLSRIRLQHYRWSINSHTSLSLAAVRRKLLRDQTVKLSSRPARLHEQPMDLCGGIDAPFDQLLEIIRRIGTGERARHISGENAGANSNVAEDLLRCSLSEQLKEMGNP